MHGHELSVEHHLDVGQSIRSELTRGRLVLANGGGQRDLRLRLDRGEDSERLSAFRWVVVVAAASSVFLALVTGISSRRVDRQKSWGFLVASMDLVVSPT